MADLLGLGKYLRFLIGWLFDLAPIHSFKIDFNAHSFASTSTVMAPVLLTLCEGE